VKPLGLCLAGPTAGGKSALALQLAETLHGAVEFISVDSAQVYRGMDIGTAKPSAAERARVPHHLIDLLEPEQAYSAARSSPSTPRRSTAAWTSAPRSPTPPSARASRIT